MELKTLRERLTDLDDVTNIEHKPTGIVAFDVEAGHYSPLTNEILDVVSLHDCHIYPDKEGHDYWAVP